MKTDSKPFQSLTERNKKKRIVLYIEEKIKHCNWSIKDGKKLYRFPSWLLGRVYSKADVLFIRGRWIKARLCYPFIPAEYTIDKIPIIVDVLVHDDQIALPEDTIYMSYQELKQVFINNKFSD